MTQMFFRHWGGCCALVCMFMGASGDALAQRAGAGRYSLDGIQVELVPGSGGKYSGIKYVDKEGKSTKISVPNLTKAMVSHYRPRHSLSDSYEVESEIGTAVVAEGRLWFGMSFYGGEGNDGMGGVGFFDPKLNRLGMLRHPALVDCSARAVQVTPLEIVVLTYSQGELSSGICNGLVRIDRKNLASSIHIPAGNIQTVWDKDGELTDKEEVVRAQYENAGSDLIESFKGWPRRTGPSVTAIELQQFGKDGFDNYLIGQTEFERDWFEHAVISGRVLFDQRCSLVIDAPPSCAPALVKRDVSKRCEDGTGECAMSRLISLHLWPNSGNYRCSPSAWLSIPLYDDDRDSGFWHMDSYLAPGRAHNPIGGAPGYESRLAPIVTAGHRSVLAAEGQLHEFQVESIEYVDVSCAGGFAKMSGPAIKSVGIRMTTVDVDQEFVPAIYGSK